MYCSRFLNPQCKWWVYRHVFNLDIGLFLRSLEFAFAGLMFRLDYFEKKSIWSDIESESTFSGVVQRVEVYWSVCSTIKDLRESKIDNFLIVFWYICIRFIPLFSQNNFKNLIFLRVMSKFMRKKNSCNFLLRFVCCYLFYRRKYSRLKLVLNNISRIKLAYVIFSRICMHDQYLQSAYLYIVFEWPPYFLIVT